MTNLQRAQLALETKRREIGKLIETEDRAEDFQDRLAAAKKAIEDAQTSYRLRA